MNVSKMNEPDMKNISDISTMGVMSSIQVAHVELDEHRMESTVMKALLSKDRNKPLFYNAREIDSSKYTTYGEVIQFIDGGPGDLRRLGVHPGEVVVYGAPPGGGMSYTAFLFDLSFSNLLQSFITLTYNLTIFMDCLCRSCASACISFDCRTNYSGATCTEYARERCHIFHRTI